MFDDLLIILSSLQVSLFFHFFLEKKVEQKFKFFFVTFALMQKWPKDQGANNGSAVRAGPAHVQSLCAGISVPDPRRSGIYRCFFTNGFFDFLISVYVLFGNTAGAVPPLTRFMVLCVWSSCGEKALYQSADRRVKLHSVVLSKRYEMIRW